MSEYDDDLRWEDVGASSDWQAGQSRVVAIGARKVGIVRLDGGLKAFKDQCPHFNLPLCENGGYQGSVVSCPHHGWEFDLDQDGAGPHGTCLRIYPVREHDGRVLVGV